MGYKKPFRIDFDQSKINICANYIENQEQYIDAMTEGLINILDFNRNQKISLDISQTVCSYIRFTNIAGKSKQ